MNERLAYERSIVAAFFDIDYYLSQCPRSKDNIEDPITHYLEYGWRELLDPSPTFSTGFYLSAHSDVEVSGANPLVHYAESGRFEDRIKHPSERRNPDTNYERSQIAPYFNSEFYLQQAPKLELLRDDPIAHFLEQGWRELRDPSPDFSTSFYLESHADVRESGINPLLHYAESGASEGRITRTSGIQIETLQPPAITDTLDMQKQVQSLLSEEVLAMVSDPLIFDLEYYRQTHCVSGSDAEVLVDYLKNPMRKASPYFDPEWYLVNNLSRIEDSGLAPAIHYISTGRKEKLRPSAIFDGVSIDMSQADIKGIVHNSGLFDADWYNSINGDVFRAGADPLTHYSRVGHGEYKRAPNILFDNTYYATRAVDVVERHWHPLVHYILLGSFKRISTHPLLDLAWLEKVCELPVGAGKLLRQLVDSNLRGKFSPNEYFDSNYYATRHPEATAYPGGVLAHFLEVGWKAKYDPSERFSTLRYAEANPDVRTKNANPFLHFIAHGRLEGRNPNPSSMLIPATFERFSDAEYGAEAPPIQFDAAVELPENFSSSIAVHLHLYYTEMADEFCEYLRNIPAPFHLFVSVPEGRGDILVLRSIFEKGMKNCIGVTIAQPPNRGRDVAPFLVEFGRDLLSYNLVLHLHSKRSPHSPKHAGWRRYLLHYTLGNEAVVTQILTAFHADAKIGIIQPPYHPQIKAQPKWGNNRGVVSSVLDRLGLSYIGDSCPHFPAGSFFWARTDALRPLLDGRLHLHDFDEESGQIDGTLAHGIERLFGLIPMLRGYSVVSRFIDVAHDLVNYFGKSRPFPAFGRDRTSDITAYQCAVRARTGKRGRIAVVTAISGFFDALLLPYHLEPSIDYFCVSDTITDGYGVFRLVPPPYLDADARRSARYIKTNLLRLFPNYDFVVWVDANVLIKEKVSELVAITAASGAAVGAIPHPTRRSYIEEAEIAVAMNLDDRELIAAQIKAYEDVEGLDQSNLIETNFMVFDALNPTTKEFMRIWWNEINTYSRRDQLSINYSIIKSGINWHPLLDEFMSVRDSRKFSLFRHGINEWGPKPHIYSAWHKLNENDGHLLPLHDEHRWSKHIGRLDLDVVVCVCNALYDVKACLVSVQAALAGRGRLILVDDASDRETADFLTAYAEAHGAELVRHTKRLGYTKAANAGVRVARNRNILLLNSDTIVPIGALDKLSDALDRDCLLGIVGPLSNAASAQSVPSTVGTASQTAINDIPPGMNVADMDLFLERQWDGMIIKTPLVHGFCFCVKRTVFDTIGLFDEENFPRGYGEENDFCFRTADAGFDLGILPNTYVFHSKSKSYGDGERTQLMNEGMTALVNKVTKPRISRAVATMNSQPSLQRAREAVTKLFDMPKFTQIGKRRRLFLIPSLRSDGLPAGSGYVRVLLPYRSEEICRSWEVTVVSNAQLPPIGPSDVVLIQRDAAVISSEDIMPWIAKLRRSGARLIYEIDDDLLDNDALVSRGFKGDTSDMARRVMAFSRTADCISVSSDALLKRFMTINRNVVLVPNALDRGLWNLPSPMRAALLDSENRLCTGRIKIGYVGTPTHQQDLALTQKTIENLKERFPGQIDVQIIGGFASGSTVFGTAIPLPLANDYPSFVRWLRRNVSWDIGIIPLKDSAFNASKSYLKFLECGALGMALVCSKGPEYSKVVRHNETGLLVDNTTVSWSNALEELIRNPNKRARLAEGAYKAICMEHTLDGLSPLLLSVLNGRNK